MSSKALKGASIARWYLGAMTRWHSVCSMAVDNAAAAAAADDDVGLDSDDLTDCSSHLIYILSTMAMKTLWPKVQETQALELFLCNLKAMILCSPFLPF
eukprot:1145555-Pelagomonas_calceolata.AAC.3